MRLGLGEPQGMPVLVAYRQAGGLQGDISHRGLQYTSDPHHSQRLLRLSRLCRDPLQPQQGPQNFILVGRFAIVFDGCTQTAGEVQIM